MLRSFYIHLSSREPQDFAAGPPYSKCYYGITYHCHFGSHRHCCSWLWSAHVLCMFGPLIWISRFWTAEHFVDWRSLTLGALAPGTDLRSSSGSTGNIYASALLASLGSKEIRRLPSNWLWSDSIPQVLPKAQWSSALLLVPCLAEEAQTHVAEALPQFLTCLRYWLSLSCRESWRRFLHLHLEAHNPYILGNSQTLVMPCCWLL